MSRRRAALAVLGVLVVALAAVVGPVGPALAATNPTLTVDAPDAVTVGESVDAALVVESVGAGDDIGAYQVNLTYDASAISVAASDTANFTVTTANPDTGVLTLVGYTDELDTPGGTLTVANLTITGDAAADAVTIDVAVETFSDTDGNALPHATNATTLAVEAAATPTPDDGGGAPPRGGTGGGGAPSTATPAPDVTDNASAVVSGQAEVTVNATGTGAVSAVVTGAAAGDRVTVNQTAEAIDRSVEQTGSAVESLSMTFDQDADFDVTVETFSDNPEADAGDPPGGAAGYVRVDHTADDAVVGEVEFVFRVSPDRLEARGLDRNEVAFYRLVDGEWTELETTFLGSNADGSLRFRAVSPGLSLFAIGQRSAATTESPVPTTAEPETTTTAVTDTPPTTTAEPPETTRPGTEPGTETPDDGLIPQVPGFGFTVALLALVLAALVALARRR